MLRPNGAHLFISGKLAASDLSIRVINVDFFFWRQLVNGLSFPGQSQKNTCKVVLLFGR